MFPIPDALKHASQTAAPSCGVCGGKMANIRGRNPQEPRRDVCPTCLADRMDMIHDMASKHYGVAFTDTNDVPKLA